jgi:hypothetical protein
MSYGGALPRASQQCARIICLDCCSAWTSAHCLLAPISRCNAGIAENTGNGAWCTNSTVGNLQKSLDVMFRALLAAPYTNAKRFGCTTRRLRNQAHPRIRLQRCLCNARKPRTVVWPTPESGRALPEIAGRSRSIFQ